MHLLFCSIFFRVHGCNFCFSLCVRTDNAINVSVTEKLKCAWGAGFHELCTALENSSSASVWRRENLGFSYPALQAVKPGACAPRVVRAWVSYLELQAGRIWKWNVLNEVDGRAGSWIMAWIIPSAFTFLIVQINPEWVDRYSYGLEKLYWGLFSVSVDAASAEQISI